MNNLKIILWICGIGCLTAFPFIVLPWALIENLYRWFGQEPVPGVPPAMYLFRITCGVVGLVGIYFIILARNPSTYLLLIKFSAFGLMAYGLLCVIVGLIVGMFPVIFLGDGLFGIILGVVIVILSAKAQKNQ